MLTEPETSCESPVANPKSPLVPCAASPVDVFRLPETAPLESPDNNVTEPLAPVDVASPLAREIDPLVPEELPPLFNSRLPPAAVLEFPALTCMFPPFPESAEPAENKASPPLPPVAEAPA